MGILFLYIVFAGINNENFALGQNTTGTDNRNNWNTYNQGSSTYNLKPVQNGPAYEVPPNNQLPPEAWQPSRTNTSYPSHPGEDAPTQEEMNPNTRQVPRGSYEDTTRSQEAEPPSETVAD